MRYTVEYLLIGMIERPELIQRIIEEHQGRIEVVTELGRGSDFRVVLPPAPEETRTADD